MISLLSPGGADRDVVFFSQIRYNSLTYRLQIA